MSLRDEAPWVMAAGAWAAAALVLLPDPTTGRRAAMVLVATCVVLLVVLLGARRGGQGRRGTALLALASVAMLAIGVLGAIRVDADARSPLRAAAGDDAARLIEGVVVDDPRPIRDGSGGVPGDQARVVVEIRVERLAQDAAALRLRARTTLFAPASWVSVPVGARVQALASWSADPDPRRLPTASTRLDPVLVSAPGPVDRVVDEVRAGLRTAAAATGGDGAALVPALVLGDTSSVPEYAADRMRDAGLGHLSAVSGANVAIMLAAVLLGLRLLRVRGRALVAAGLMAVVAFAVLTRLEPSVLRAGVMAALLLLAAWRGGAAGARQALPVAVLLLLLVDPWLALSSAFALSVAATAGLVLLAPWVLADRRGRVRRAVVSAFAAQAAVAPLVAGLSGRLDAGGLIANLLAEPLVAPATVLGLAAASVAPLLPPAGALLAAAASVPATGILVVADAVASSRWAVLPWPPGPLGAVLLAMLLGAGILAVAHRPARDRSSATGTDHRHRRVRRLRAVLLVGCLLGVAVLPLQAERRWPPPSWRIVLCDVGQGDAIVLAAGDDAAIVIDTGPDARAMDACLRDLGIARIPLLVLTHFHADHIGGLPGALRGRSVGRMLVGPLAEPDEGYRSVQRAAQGLPQDVAVAGAATRVEGWVLTVLGPTVLTASDGSAPNNASVLLRAERPGTSLLLLGDAERAAQERLLAAVPPALVRADVLKVPHHGSAVQVPDLLRSVQARVALIGVGCGNRYGHPAPATLAVLARSGAEIARTDRHGAVAVLADGRTVAAAPGSRSPSRCADGVGGP